jgi:hypothetical protein
MSSDSSSDLNYDETGNNYDECEEEENEEEEDLDDIVEDDMIQMQLQFILLETAREQNANLLLTPKTPNNPAHQSIARLNNRIKSIKINGSFINLEIGDLTLSNVSIRKVVFTIFLIFRNLNQFLLVLALNFHFKNSLSLTKERLFES